MSEDFGKKVIANHGKTIELAKEIQAVVNKFLAKEDENLSVNDRFLVASRAINVQAKLWCEHFHNEFDATKYLENLVKDDNKLSASKIVEET